MESVATPAAFRVTVPSAVAPFMKLTVPPGMIAPVPFTVAVKIRAWPDVTLGADATRLVVVP